jgi:hypothetical protein
MGPRERTIMIPLIPSSPQKESYIKYVLYIKSEPVEFGKKKS